MGEETRPDGPIRPYTADDFDDEGFVLTCACGGSGERRDQSGRKPPRMPVSDCACCGAKVGEHCKPDCSTGETHHPRVDIREARRILLLAAREEREAADLAFEERNEDDEAWYIACLNDFSERSGAATAYRRAARLIRPAHQ